MKIDAATIAAIYGIPVSDNLRSTVAGLALWGAELDLDRPERLVHYLGQTAHESALWRYDREIASGAAYEGRADLGNTQPGDGKRFRGRTALQVTGRRNYRGFTAWVRQRFPAAPNFENEPTSINTDPWEGIAPLWYWATHGLGRLADENNLLAITRVINGGTNGLGDRYDRTDQASLGLLGYPDVKAFQGAAGLKVDGIVGDRTRAALHAELSDMAALTFAPPPAAGDTITAILADLDPLLARLRALAGP